MIKNNRYGIALITLSIILMVLVLLSGVITYIGYDIMVTAKNTAFAKDMETIVDSIEEYYAVNGSLPVLEDGKKITADVYKSNIEELLGETLANELAEELVKNDDENATFYEIDISKIGIDDLKYGIKETPDDIYVISSDSHIVYYYCGYENSSGFYFSNTDLIDK